MYHRPGSDRHIGRHARTQQRRVQPRPPARDDHGRQIPPPPPRAVFTPAGPLAAAARSGGGDALTAVCWEALCATNPAGLTAPGEQQEVAYRAVARTVAAQLRSAVSAPRHRHLVEWIAAACATQLDATVLRGRTRRCATWILASGEWRWRPPRRPVR